MFQKKTFIGSEYTNKMLIRVIKTLVKI